MINTWGEDPKPLPATVCTNLTKNIGWTKASAKELPVGEESTIEIGPSDIPTYKRGEEVDQDDLEDASENQENNDTKLGATGQVTIIPDATNNETDTESLNNVRMMNNDLDDNASSDMSEVNEDEAMTGTTVRKLWTAHSDDSLTEP